MLTRRRVISAGLAFAYAWGALGCKKAGPTNTAPATNSNPLPQSAYLWQREWTPQVSGAVKAHSPAFENLALLAAQVEWREPSGEPKIVRPAIDLITLAKSARTIGLVIRVQRAGSESATAKTLVEIFQARLAEAARANVVVSELQIDFDCPQKKLASYLQWFRQIKKALEPTHLPLLITALPTWLGEQNFTTLADATDGYILQVHSFDLTTLGKAPTVCDPATALAWVAQAARLGRPFYIALPTYRCLAGYAADGRYLGMAADAGTPSWPPGTNILELDSDPLALADLVAGWTKSHPANLRGIYWYRLPIEGEARNWRWPTLAAVMAGRAPLSKLEIHATTGNPIDFTLCNLGEKDEAWPTEIQVRWEGPELVVADAVAGWACQTSPHQILFRRSPSTATSRLSPDHTIPLGWIRHHEAPATVIPFSFEIVR